MQTVANRGKIKFLALPWGMCIVHDVIRYTAKKKIRTCSCFDYT